MTPKTYGEAMQNPTSAIRRFTDNVAVNRRDNIGPCLAAWEALGHDRDAAYLLSDYGRVWPKSV